MKLLSIDSSGKTAACAVTEDGAVLCESFVNTGLTHSQTLLPMTDEMLKQAGIDIDDIDELAITIGPGSFTGLRIGLAMVMGLAGNRKIRGVPTLAALAHNVSDDGIIIPALDARRNQVYTAVFECKNGIITRIEEDSAESVDDVLKKASGYAKENKVFILGDGAYLFENKLESNMEFAKELYPTGQGIARAADGITALEPKDIQLSYLRLSQAERELKEKMEK